MRGFPGEQAKGRGDLTTQPGSSDRCVLTRRPPRQVVGPGSDAPLPRSERNEKPLPQDVVGRKLCCPQFPTVWFREVSGREAGQGGVGVRGVSGLALPTPWCPGLTPGLLLLCALGPGTLFTKELPVQLTAVCITRGQEPALAQRQQSPPESAVSQAQLPVLRLGQGRPAFQRSPCPHLHQAGTGAGGDKGV